MDIQLAATTNNNFSINFFKTVVKDRGQENIFVSPFSISTALAMTHLGTKGETARGMDEALCWPTDATEDIHKQYQKYLSLLQELQDNFKLSSANRIYIQKSFPIVKEFKEKSKLFYLADPVSANFVEDAEGERANINTWVEEQTHKKIKDLIQQGVLNDATRMILVNATYFKGDWEIKFEESETKPRKFKTAPGHDVEVPMMNANEKYRISKSEELNSRAIEIPYKGNDLSMIIILPEEDFGLQNLINSLTPENLQALLLGLSRAVCRDKMQLSIPKFEVTSSHSLKEALTSLGMKDAFCEGTADFSGMTGGKHLSLSAVVHKAFVKVDEKGTEAAAATATVVMMRCARMERPRPFIVDHPFLFLIKDKRASSDGIFLFIGSILDPSK